eukprot:1840556-Rhodomonas_salina.1
MPVAAHCARHWESKTPQCRKPCAMSAPSKHHAPHCYVSPEPETRHAISMVLRFFSLTQSLAPATMMVETLSWWCDFDSPESQPMGCAFEGQDSIQSIT